jgi:CrcB protein
MSRNMFPYVLVMIGGAIGSAFRFHVSRVALATGGPGLPIGTWVVNLVGGLLMGILAGMLARDGVEDEPLRLFVGVGMLGGFTTFSAFSLEVFNMLARNEYLLALAYAVSSVAGSVLAVFAGVMLTRMAA